MVVKNLNGSPQTVCGCGSWLNHWRRYGKPSAAFAQRQRCAVVVCDHPIELGVPVQKEVLDGVRVLGMRGDASWYVLPLCLACSQKPESALMVDDGCGLAPTSLQETCGMAGTAGPPP